MVVEPLPLPEPLPPEPLEPEPPEPPVGAGLVVVGDKPVTLLPGDGVTTGSGLGVPATGAGVEVLAGAGVDTGAGAGAGAGAGVDTGAGAGLAFGAVR